MISLRYKLLVQHSALTPALMLLQYPKKGLLAELCVGRLAESLLALNKVAVFFGRSSQYLKQAVVQGEDNRILQCTVVTLLVRNIPFSLLLGRSDKKDAARGIPKVTAICHTIPGIHATALIGMAYDEEGGTIVLCQSHKRGHTVADRISRTHVDLWR